MKKQISRLSVWVIVFAIAAGVSFYIHRRIVQSGEASPVPLRELFERAGVKFGVADGEADCVSTGLDGMFHASGDFVGKFGEEQSLFRHDGIPKPRPQRFSMLADGRGRVTISVEKCRYDDLEFKDLELVGADGEWTFTGRCTVPLPSVGDTKLPAGTRIADAKVAGVWRENGIEFTAVDKSFSYNSVAEELAPEEEASAAAPGHSAENHDFVKKVKVELLSTNKP